MPTKNKTRNTKNCGMLAFTIVRDALKGSFKRMVNMVNSLLVSNTPLKNQV